MFAAKFMDGFYIGEVVSIVDQEHVKVSYMQPKRIVTADDAEHPRRFWCWSKPKHNFKTHRSCILNLSPSLCLAIPPLTKKLLVFSYMNAEFLQKVAESVTEEI